MSFWNTITDFLFGKKKDEEQQVQQSAPVRYQSTSSNSNSGNSFSSSNSNSGGGYRTFDTPSFGSILRNTLDPNSTLHALSDIINHKTEEDETTPKNDIKTYDISEQKSGQKVQNVDKSIGEQIKDGAIDDAKHVWRSLSIPVNTIAQVGKNLSENKDVTHLFDGVGENVKKTWNGDEDAQGFSSEGKNKGTVNLASKSDNALARYGFGYAPEAVGATAKDAGNLIFHPIKTLQDTVSDFRKLMENPDDPNYAQNMKSKTNLDQVMSNYVANDKNIADNLKVDYLKTTNAKPENEADQAKRAETGGTAAQFMFDPLNYFGVGEAKKGVQFLRDLPQNEKVIAGLDKVNAMKNDAPIVLKDAANKVSNVVDNNLFKDIRGFKNNPDVIGGNKEEVMRQLTQDSMKDINTVDGVQNIDGFTPQELNFYKDRFKNVYNNNNAGDFRQWMAELADAQKMEKAPKMDVQGLQNDYQKYANIQKDMTKFDSSLNPSGDLAGVRSMDDINKYLELAQNKEDAAKNLSSVLKQNNTIDKSISKPINSVEEMRSSLSKQLVDKTNELNDTLKDMSNYYKGADVNGLSNTKIKRYAHYSGKNPNTIMQEANAIQEQLKGLENVSLPARETTPFKLNQETLTNIAPDMGRQVNTNSDIANELASLADKKLTVPENSKLQDVQDILSVPKENPTDGIANMTQKYADAKAEYNDFLKNLNGKVNETSNFYKPAQSLEWANDGSKADNTMKDFLESVQEGKNTAPAPSSANPMDFSKVEDEVKNVPEEVLAQHPKVQEAVAGLNDTQKANQILNEVPLKTSFANDLKQGVMAENANKEAMAQQNVAETIKQVENEMHSANIGNVTELGNDTSKVVDQAEKLKADDEYKMFNGITETASKKKKEGVWSSLVDGFKNYDHNVKTTEENAHYILQKQKFDSHLNAVKKDILDNGKRILKVFGNKKNYEVGSMKYHIDELLADMEKRAANGENPYENIDIQDFKNKQAELAKIIEKNPKIQKGIDEMRKTYKALAEEYVGRMKSLGFEDIEKHFTNDMYAPHIFSPDKETLYAQIKSSGANLGHGGYLKARQAGVGYETDMINAYVKYAEKMQSDIEKAKLVQVAKEHNDVSSTQMPIAIKNAMSRLAAKYQVPNQGGFSSILNKILEAKQFERFSPSKVDATNIPMTTQTKNAVKELSSIIDKFGNDTTKLFADTRQLENLTNQLSDVFEKNQVLADIEGEFNRVVVEELKKLTPSGYKLFPIDEKLGIAKDPAQNLTYWIIDSVTNGNVNEQLLMRKLNKTMLIPEGIAKSLDKTLSPEVEISAFKKLVKDGNNAYKLWNTLGNPFKALKYMAKNGLGDNIRMAFEPKSLFYKPKAGLDVLLYNTTGRIPKGVTKEQWAVFMEEAHSSSRVYNDLADYNNQLAKSGLKNLNRQMGLTDFLKIPGKVAYAPFKALSHGINTVNDARELSNRWAATMYFNNALEKGKVMYGMSNKNLIRGIDDGFEKAVRLGNDLVGNFRDISENGRKLRGSVVPFWGFQESNFKAYWNGFKNTLDSDIINEKLAAKGIGSNVVTRNFMRMTGLSGKFSTASLGMIGMYAWNRQHQDIENKLPDYIRMKPHLILGKDENSVITFSGVDTFTDFLDWFNMGGVTQDFWFGKDPKDPDLKKTTGQKIGDTLTAPITKGVNSLHGLIKLPFELAGGKSYFPDPLNPTPISDKGEYLAKAVGMGPLYKEMTNAPTRKNAFRDSLIGDATDLKESAYNKFTYTTEPELEKKLGIKSNSVYSTGTDEDTAAINDLKSDIKKAAMYGDSKKVEEYMEQYFSMVNDQLQQEQASIKEYNANKSSKAKAKTFDPYEKLDTYLKNRNPDSKFVLTPAQVESLSTGKTKTSLTAAKKKLTELNQRNSLLQNTSDADDYNDAMQYWTDMMNTYNSAKKNYEKRTTYR